MADLLGAQGDLKTPFLTTETAENVARKKSNVKILVFPSGSYISHSGHHFQGFSPFKNPASFQSISGIRKDKLAMCV